MKAEDICTPLSREFVGAHKGLLTADKGEVVYCQTDCLSSRLAVSVHIVLRHLEPESRLPEPARRLRVGILDPLDGLCQAIHRVGLPGGASGIHPGLGPPVTPARRGTNPGSNRC